MITTAVFTAKNNLECIGVLIGQMRILLGTQLPYSGFCVGMRDIIKKF